MFPAIEGPPTPEMVNAGRAAELLGVDKRTILRLAHAGKIRSYRTPGGQHRFRREDVEALAAGEAGRTRPSVSVVQNKRDEIESLNLEVQSRKAKRELARIEAEDAAAERERAQARRQTEQEAERAQQERKERARQDRAERRERAERQAREQQRRDWESQWIKYAVQSLPADTPPDVKLAMQQAVRETLATWRADHPNDIIADLVSSVCQQALEPWERRKETEQAINDAARDLQLFASGDPRWELLAKQEARKAINALASDSSLAEIRAVSTQAVKSVAHQYHQQQAEKEHRESIQSVLGWVSGDEAKDAVRQALEKLPVACGGAQMERAKDAVLAPIREKERVADEARRKEAQAAFDADRHLWRVGEYIETMHASGDYDLGSFWDRIQLAERIKRKTRPALIQALLCDELDADAAREWIEEAVNREI